MEYTELKDMHVKKLINKYIMKLKNTAGITKNSKKSANT